MRKTSAVSAPRELKSQFTVPRQRAPGYSCNPHQMAQSTHTPQRIAFEAARRQLGDAAAADAAARDLAHAFGAVHPEAGTLRAIKAVIDQLDNPASFARNKDAYQKHGASEDTFEKWK